MRNIILLITVFTLSFVNTVQAQNRRPVQRKSPTVSRVQKTAPAKPVVDKELKILRLKIDSLEDLRNDLLNRCEKYKDIVTKIDENGNEYQIARAVRDGSVLYVYLRVRNMQKFVTLNFHSRGQILNSTFELDNGDSKKEFGPSLVPVEKGYWHFYKAFTLYNIKTLPTPKFITSLSIDEENISSPIIFNNIPIIKNE